MPLRLTPAAARRAGLTGPPRKPRKPPVMVAPAMVLTVTIPVATSGTLNSREHHYARARRVKAERETVATWLRVLVGQRPRELAAEDRRLTITLTRLGGRKLDGDQVPGILKAVRDELCAWLWRDDGDELLTFGYAQEPGGPRGVRVTVAAGRTQGRMSDAED